MTDHLLSPTFLFRFSTPCLYRRNIWGARGVQLGPLFRLPSFGELEGKQLFAETRAAWNMDGISFNVRVSGKRQAPWCQSTRAESSDGLHVWIDTRDTHNIHRASRYCHRFVFMPGGIGPRLQSPLAKWLPINRAREQPKTIRAETLRVRSEPRSDGYLLEGHVPAAMLAGWDPGEHPRIGFSYAVVDRELGWQTFTIGNEFPITEDPSLWGTLELEKGRE